MSAGGLGAGARKARLVHGFFGGRPIHCTWQLLPRCESFCQFCDHRAEAAASALDTEGWARVAERLGAAGSLLVSLTGSDPFLRGDLPAIVAAVARWHFPLLVTNGWLVTPASARAVWEAGLEVATVTLFDAEPAAHDAVTGVGGSHARAEAALETLARERTAASQRVNVRTRLSGPDLSRLPALLELAAGHSATVVVEAAFPLPETRTDANGLGARLREIRRRHPNLRASGPVLEGLAQALHGGVPGCQAGRAFFNVDHKGWLSKCLEFQGDDDRVGTLAEEDLAPLLPRLRARHEANGCQACWYASRAEVEALYTVKGFFGGLAELVRA